MPNWDNGQFWDSGGNWDSVAPPPPGPGIREGVLSTGLPVSRYVSVQVSLTTPAVTAQAINNCLIVTSDPVIDAGERMRTYYNISEVARDFGTASVAYGAASIWFSQNPRPRQVQLGRWITAPTPGTLICAILPPQEQAISLWRAIGSTRPPGQFVITINGTPQTVSGLNFSTQTNLNGVASVINAALTGATVHWTGQRFVFETTTTGVGQELWYLSDVQPETGTNIATMMRASEATASRRIDGQAQETALSAVVAIDALFSSLFYGVVVPEANDEDKLQISAYCEASDPVHYAGHTSADTNILDAMHTTDVASQLYGFGFNKTAIQFSTRSRYAICSYLARILVTDWNGFNTVPTLMYKRQPGIMVENISSQQADTLRDKNCNVFTGVANGAQITQYGFSSSGQWTDTIIGADALALNVQNALFNALYTTPTKIPMTDFGMNILVNLTSATCGRFERAGYLGPGIWNAPGFGQLETGMSLNHGFYVWAPSIGDMDPADRQARRSPLIQVAAKCASAIHEANVLIYVNE